MQKRHIDSDLYFKEQIYTTEKYVIPYIEQFVSIKKNMSVLEIGCSEAGNLKPFLDRDCICYGVDISERRINLAEKHYSDDSKRANLHLEVCDIYDKAVDGVTYDIIFMRDVIEHIPEQDKMIAFLRNFMHKDTVVFFAFPPWQNPFGGHQQVCKSKVLSHLPFFHLLPKSLYKGILKAFGEDESVWKELLEIKDTGLSIERFKSCVRDANLKIKEETFFFINPHYQIKFGLKPRKTWSFINKIPYLRNFAITTMYSIVSL